MFTQSPSTRNANSSFTRNFSSTNLQRFNEDLYATDLDEVFCCDDPEVAFNTFMGNFNHLYDKNIPLTRHNHKTKTNYTSNTPWITHSLLNQVSESAIDCKRTLSFYEDS